MRKKIRARLGLNLDSHDKKNVEIIFGLGLLQNIFAFPFLMMITDNYDLHY